MTCFPAASPAAGRLRPFFPPDWRTAAAAPATRLGVPFLVLASETSLCFFEAQTTNAAVHCWFFWNVILIYIMNKTESGARAGLFIRAAR